MRTVTSARLIRLSAAIACAVIATTAATASAPAPQSSTASFAILAGTAVTCTDSHVAGDVGVWPGTAVTQT